MWRFRGWRFQRKDLLFVVGLVGIALEEARIFGQPSETMILVFAAMMGLPIFLRADEKRESSPPTGKNGPDSLDGRSP